MCSSDLAPDDVGRLKKWDEAKRRAGRAEAAGSVRKRQPRSVGMGALQRRSPTDRACHAPSQACIEAVFDEPHRQHRDCRVLRVRVRVTSGFSRDRYRAPGPVRPAPRPAIKKSPEVSWTKVG